MAGGWVGDRNRSEALELAGDVTAAGGEVAEGLRDVEIGGGRRCFQRLVVVGAELNEVEVDDGVC